MRKHRDGWGCIYSALNLVKDLEYIGKDQTGDPKNHRWKNHAMSATKIKPKSYFVRAVKAAGGPEFFKWSVIWRGPVEELCAKEVYYIARRHTWVGDPKCRGYNLTQGGDGLRAGFKHSKKAKRRMSVAQQRRWDALTSEERSAFGKKVSKSKSLENCSDSSKRGWASRTPRKRAATCKKMSVAAKHHWATLTSEERSAALKKSANSMSLNQRAARAEKVWVTRRLNLEKMTPAELTAEHKKVSNAARLAWALKTLEERFAHGRKSAATRRRNAKQAYEEERVKLTLGGIGSTRKFAGSTRRA
jgi:hypothetical protein